MRVGDTDSVLHMQERVNMILRVKAPTFLRANTPLLDCSYKWFSTEEICIILERLNSLIFLGDNMLRDIYGAFNILLRGNLALGALSQWEMDDQKLCSIPFTSPFNLVELIFQHRRKACRCDAQFTNTDCHEHFVNNSTSIMSHDHLSRHPSPFFCPSATSPEHSYIPITSFPIPPIALKDVASIFLRLKTNPSRKTIPIIFHVGLSLLFSWPQTADMMSSIASVLEEVAPNTKYKPIVLWLNPAAAGHLKPPGSILQQGNEAIWGFSQEMEQEARRRGWEVLGMWNATVQEQSWDGSNYGNAFVKYDILIVH